MFRLLFGLVAMPLVLCELAVIRHGSSFTPWAIANVAIYPLIVLASIALHEAGHALAGRAVGLDVLHVQLGVGRRLAAWRWGQTRITLHALPLLGLTYLGSRPRRGLRWRYWLAIAAGPMVTFAIVYFAGHDPFPTAPVVHHFAPVEVIGYANVWMLVFNLVPLPVLRSRGLLRNDGGQLLSVPFMAAKKLQGLNEMPAILAAQEAHERDDHQGALHLVTAALVDLPDSWALRNSLALAQLHLQQLSEARASFQQLIESEPPFPDMRWLARNNLAWVDFLLARDELRDEADEHSQAVHERFKRVSWAMGTRGAVLGWLGRHDEAVPLLERAYLLNTLGMSRASNAACLAVSLAGLGLVDEAAAWLEKARTNHAACVLLGRAQAAVEAAKRATTSEGCPAPGA